MNRKVLVSSGAAADLQRLEAFLVGRSPEAAVNAIDSILDAIASLTEFGDRGAPGDPPGTRNLFIPFGRGAYALNYRADDHEVVVARIFHSLEDRPLA